MKTLAVVLWIAILLAKYSPAQALSSGRENELQRQIAEVQRQRQANQRLMLEAAFDSAEDYANFVLSQGDLGSGENLKRIVEISDNIKTAVRNNDAVGAANLISEIGRLVGLEVLTKVSQAGDVVGTLISLPLNLWPAAQAYLRFAERVADDSQLLDREVALRRRMERTEPAKAEIAPPPPIAERPSKYSFRTDFRELDQAISDWAKADSHYRDEYAKPGEQRDGDNQVSSVDGKSVVPNTVPSECESYRDVIYRPIMGALDQLKGDEAYLSRTRMPAEDMTEWMKMISRNRRNLAELNKSLAACIAKHGK